MQQCPWVVISKVAEDSHLQVFYFSLFLKGQGQGADIGRWDDTMSHPSSNFGIFLLLTKKAPGATGSRQQAGGRSKKQQKGTRKEAMGFQDKQPWVCLAFSVSQDKPSCPTREPERLKPRAHSDGLRAGEMDYLDGTAISFQVSSTPTYLESARHENKILKREERQDWGCKSTGKHKSGGKAHKRYQQGPGFHP